jgi:hypothetical protein
MLRLCVLTSERRYGTVGGSALGEKIAQTFLPGRRRAYLAVSRGDTESKEQTY